MADARTAYCLAMGVDTDDINPADGYDNSRRAYEASRRSWIDLMRYEGLSYFYVRPDLEKVTARWTRNRPEFTEGDDWAAAGVSAHVDYWHERGGRCRKDDCLLHDPGRIRFEAGYALPDGAGERVAVWVVGDTHATLRTPDGAEAETSPVPVGADEATALHVIMERWGEDLTRWDQIPQEPDQQPADEAPRAAPADEPPTPADVIDRLF